MQGQTLQRSVYKSFLGCMKHMTPGLPLYVVQIEQKLLQGFLARQFLCGANWTQPEHLRSFRVVSSGRGQDGRAIARTSTFATSFIRQHHFDISHYVLWVKRPLLNFVLDVVSFE